MSYLSGWVETSIRDQAADALLREQSSLFNASSSLYYSTTDFHGFATEADRFHQQDDLILMDVSQGAKNLNKAGMLAAYQENEAGFLKNITPHAPFVLVDDKNKLVLLATDPIGMAHVYYAHCKNGLVFGDAADKVANHPEIGDEISSQMIFNYVYFHHCPSPDTIFTKVKKLEPGQVLVYQNGKINLDTYWQPEFHESLSCSEQEAGDKLKECLVQSVTRQVDTAEYTGAFLSGGLDSSSVAGALAKVFPDQAKTFSMGFPVDGYDEIEYARTAVEHFNTIQHEFYLSADDTVAAIPDIAAYYDEPFGNSSALAALYCARMAKEKGIKVLLAGDGGDELFAGNERYVKQLVFERYYQMPSPMRSILKGGLYNLPDVMLNNKILFKGKRYIEQAEIPLPDRLQDYNFLHRHAIEDIFNADFIEQIDVSVPLKGLQNCYHKPKQAEPLNRMLYMDWKSTLHDNDLIKVNKMCEMAGVEVQYPMLTPEMVEFSCTIPSSLKLKNGKLRGFYKQAMSGFLPDKIINKPKHGFGLPFGVWLKDHQPLRELAYDSLKALKKREYIRPGFIDHAIEMHQSIHAAYYGELVWILMMLELWFQAKSR